MPDNENEICYECQVNGDEYCTDEDGVIVLACKDCPCRRDDDE